MNDLLRLEECLTWVTALAAFGAILSTAELLYNRRLFRDNSLLAWPLISEKYHQSKLQLRWLLEYPRFVGLLIARFLASVLLLLSLTPWVSLLPLTSVCVAVLFVTRLLVNFRLFLPDGSESMDTLLWGGLMCAWALPASPTVREASLWFIALQACLCYAVNGWRRLKDPPWRHDQAVSLVLDHPLYGARYAAGLAKNLPETLGQLLVVSVVVVEITFPLVLIAGFPLCWLFIGWGIAFHIFNALALGLNHFVFPFFATYPAILFCVARIEAWSAQGMSP